MAKCENCYHCEICKKAAINLGIPEAKLIEVLNKEFEHIEGHDCFKDKSLIVELPCKVGDTVYILNHVFYARVTPCVDYYEILEEKIKKISIGESEIKMRSERFEWYMSDFGETVFMNYEDAEKALEEIEKK